MTTLVHMVSLGCARNDVDSEELAARLAAGGFGLTDDAADADVIVVNTCGFIEQAKKDSIDTLLAAADYKQQKTRAVVAVGCMAERYGQELADSLPEADAVLGFDSYPQIAAKLKAILAGEHLASHQPSDRRKLLPLAPVARQAAKANQVTPGHQLITDQANSFTRGELDQQLAKIAPASGPTVLRRRLTSGPFAPLKIASGCDRHCAFCAIPSFRGAYLSRPIDEIIAEANWLASNEVKEVMLVSENTSSYGKDFADRKAFANLLAELAKVDGLEWVRVSYLQPAELRPDMIAAMAQTEKVVPYFDLPFQHASASVLRKMRRFGNPDAFLGLLEQIRHELPEAGIRSNVIVGFPGETEADVQELADFLSAADLDVVGVFAYSDEEGTEGASLPDHLPADEIEQRQAMITDLVENLCNDRATERIGTSTDMLVLETSSAEISGRTVFQGPEVDGAISLVDPQAGYQVGDILPVEIVDSFGVDLVGRPLA